MKRYLLILNLLLAVIVLFLGVNIISALIAKDREDISISYHDSPKKVLQGTGKAPPLSFYKTIHKHNLFSKNPPGPGLPKQLEVTLSDGELETSQMIEIHLKLNVKPQVPTMFDLFMNILPILIIVILIIAICSPCQQTACCLPFTPFRCFYVQRPNDRHFVSVYTVLRLTG